LKDPFFQWRLLNRAIAAAQPKEEEEDSSDEEDPCYDDNGDEIYTKPPKPAKGVTVINKPHNPFNNDDFQAFEGEELDTNGDLISRCIVIYHQKAAHVDVLAILPVGMIQIASAPESRCAGRRSPKGTIPRRAAEAKAELEVTCR
jgi:hypothetical protein